MAEKKRLVLLDTHAILHRAYHALPDFSSSKGEPTGALYGLISMLVRIISDLKPDYIVAAYDLPKPTLRHLVYEGYKATRPKAQEDLVAQIKRSRDVIAAFGIPSYEKERFEADDIIGTVAQELKKNNDVEIIIASGDMDTLQLVEADRVKVYTLKKGLTETVLYDEKGVNDRFGFSPALIADYKGLRGDPSDNIPGVKGVGEKTATILISTFGSIDNIYTALKKAPKKLEAAGIKEGMLERLAAEEEEARFSKMLAQIRMDVPIDFELPKKSWKESASPERVLDLLSELEFRSLMPRVRALFGAAAAPEEKNSETTSVRGDLPPQEEVEKLGLAAWVLDSSITEPTLEDIERLGKSKDFSQARKHILAELTERELVFVYEDIELPLRPVLRQMEERGILLDRKLLGNLSKKYHTDLEKLALQIYALAGGQFNINSPRQLGEVLFDKLGLVPKNPKKTATGARTTRESELEKMRDQHPIIGEVLSYRELQKLLSTYIDSIPALLDGKDRLHTHYIQTGTTTGRIASQDPNLQNIPIKSDLGRAIRNAFVAEEGFTLVSFDYSQVELRIAAILSQDETLMEIFKHGEDVHAAVASRIFNVSEKDVTYEQRRRAKVINFGILYGMGVNALKEGLGTSRKEAQEFYNHYFETFSRLSQYLDETKLDAARRGYTQTLFGRRRYFEGIRSAIPYVRAAAERMAVNAPMQGTQSDIVKLAMIRLAALFEEKEYKGAFMLLQVHDELLFEIKDSLVSSLTPKIKEIMEGVLSSRERHGVPLIAEGSSGKNWGEMKKL
ncbi:MAG: hypothetical protein KGJ34_01440 [Patescibacteria group bacterium]|nr:hypothetical protein [Patescibacteria group bacterium]